MIGALVLAAGGGSRFGSPKQLAELRGRPLLEHALNAAAAAPVDRTAVVLGANAAEIARRVPLHGAEVVVAADWREGQAASLRAGISVLGEECEAIVIVLGDQPLIEPGAISRVIAARGGEVQAIRATYRGRPGHPVLFERAAFGEIATLTGDTGARALLERLGAREVPCDGLGRPDDVDTPEQLGAIASGRS